MNWDEQLTELERGTVSLIESVGFEILPIEQCRQKNKELWDNSLLGRKRNCHGCGREVTGFGMLYIFRDSRDKMKEVSVRFSRGELTFREYHKRMTSLEKERYPTDGWYCSQSCYNRTVDAR